MCRLCEANSVKTEYIVHPCDVMLVFESPLSESIKEKTAESSQKSSQKIFELIKDNSYITTQEMADIMGISRRAIAKQLASLQAECIVKRIGPDKGGHWEITEK